MTRESHALVLLVALSVLGLAARVHSQSQTVGTRASHDENELTPTGDFELPRLSMGGAACGLELAVSLTPLGTDVASLAFVAVPVSEPPDCTGGTVLWELPRGLFEAPQQPTQTSTILLRTRVAARVLECNARYAILACARDGSGRLHAGLYSGEPRGASYTARLWRDDSSTIAHTVATPSGPVWRERLAHGDVVLAFDPASAQLVETTVRRWIAPKENAGQQPTVQLNLEDGRWLRLLADERVWNASVRAFVRAADLTPGTPLLGPDGGTPRVASVTPDPAGAVSSTQYDIAWPDTLFLDGLLVHDALPHTSSPPRTPLPLHAAAAVGGVTVRPVLPTSSCQLTVEAAIDSLPPDARGVAVVIARHPGPARTRRTLACGAGTAVTEWPRALLDAVRRTAGPNARMEVTLSGNPIRCGGLVDVVACLRDGSGALTAIEPLARVGRAGPGASPLRR